MSERYAIYFHNDIELDGSVRPIKNSQFTALGGVFSKHNRFDSFSRMAGIGSVDGPALLPVTRKIFYKVRPSLHKCDDRCRCAKGHNCECSCGGQFHGIDAV